MATVPFAWPSLTLLEQFLIVGWCLAVIVPMAYAVRSKAPLSLGIVLAVLFGLGFPAIQTITTTPTSNTENMRRIGRHYMCLALGFHGGGDGSCRRRNIHR